MSTGMNCNWEMQYDTNSSPPCNLLIDVWKAWLEEASLSLPLSRCHVQLSALSLYSSTRNRGANEAAKKVKRGARTDHLRWITVMTKRQGCRLQLGWAEVYGVILILSGFVVGASFPGSYTQVEHDIAPWWVHSGKSNVDFKSNEVNLAPCRIHYWLVCLNERLW